MINQSKHFSRCRVGFIQPLRIWLISKRSSLSRVMNLFQAVLTVAVLIETLNNFPHKQMMNELIQTCSVYLTCDGHINKALNQLLHITLLFCSWEQISTLTKAVIHQQQSFCPKVVPSKTQLVCWPIYPLTLWHLNIIRSTNKQTSLENRYWENDLRGLLLEITKPSNFKYW